MTNTRLYREKKLSQNKDINSRYSNRDTLHQ